jgi:hypothetical protein
LKARLNVYTGLGTLRTTMRRPKEIAPMRHELAFSGESSKADSCAAPTPAEDSGWLFGRSIVILGPEDRLDPEALGRSLGTWLGPRPPQLLLLTVGYPLTADQRAGVDAGMQCAIEQGLRVEARLAWTMDEALDLVSPLDEVLRCLSERLPVA